MVWEILKIAIPLVFGGIGGALITHYLAVKRERISAIFIEKRKNYEKLLEAVRGFVRGEPDEKQQFIDEMNRSWLYASDEVVRETRRFLDLYVDHAKHGSRHVPAKEVDPVMGATLLAMRKDLGFKKTALSSQEFHIVSLAKKFNEQSSKIK